jgi:hypothetical protein
MITVADSADHGLTPPGRNRSLGQGIPAGQ